MKYSIESNLSDREITLQQESYLKFREFWLNIKLKQMNLLPSTLDLNYLLPINYCEWDGRNKLQLKILLQDKIKELQYDFSPQQWSINLKKPMAYFNYLGFDYKIKESRVVASLNCEYWSILDLI